jgi:4-hydroxybenzoate polyprenyltransferase
LTPLCRALSLTRWREWAQSKLPFAAGAALLLAPGDVPLARLLLALASIAGWAAFGYAVNDVADLEVDRAAQKQNRARSMSRAVAIAVPLVSGGLAIALSVAWGADGAAPRIVAAGLALSAAYSLPPLRLKERGVLGLVAAATAQWALPVLAVAAVARGGWRTPAAWSGALLGLAIGLRWIGIHQLADEAGDRRAGVRTFAVKGGPVARLVGAAFAAELLLLALSLALTWPRSLPAAVALAGWVLLAEAPRLRRRPLAARLRSYPDAPLRAFYFALLPLSLLAARSISALGLAIAR